MNATNQTEATRVRDIMTRSVETVMSSDTIQEAVTLMIEHELSTIPVVNRDHHCIGILSRSDLTEFFLSEDHELSRVLEMNQLSLERLYQSSDTSDARLVKEMMTYDVTQISDDLELVDACREMANKRIHHLPVVDDQGVLRGILSTFDIVAAIAKNGKL